jgi:hypothetical protein
MGVQRWFAIRPGVSIATSAVASAAIAVSGAAAAGAATGRVTPAPAAAKIPTTLYLSFPQLTVTPQESSVALRGQLEQAKTSPNPFAPLSHEVVWLERRSPRGRWRIVRSKRTASDGIVNFRLHLARGTNPRFRLIFRGTATYGRAVSNVRSV